LHIFSCTGLFWKPLYVILAACIKNFILMTVDPPLAQLLHDINSCWQNSTKYDLDFIIWIRAVPFNISALLDMVVTFDCWIFCATLENIH
jgi:hypothetical protein